MDPVVISPDSQPAGPPSPEPAPQPAETPNEANKAVVEALPVAQVPPIAPAYEKLPPTPAPVPPEVINSSIDPNPLPVNGSTTPSGPTMQKSVSKSKKKLVGLVVLGLLLAGGAAAYFLVLPNRPAAVWNTGLKRSGKALNSLITQATKKETIEAFRKSDVTASLTAKFGTTDFSGTITAKYDASSANGNLVVTSKETGQPDKTFSLDFIGQMLKDHAYPSGYIKFSGLKSLGLDAALPALVSYENRWITIDEDYLKSQGLDQNTKAKETITSDDIAEFAKATTEVTTDRLFTTDSSKAVFERRKSLGKEAVDGITAYRYEVGINKAHAVDYCNAMVDKLMSTNIYKKLPFVDTDNLEKDKTEAKKSCAESINNDIKDSDTIDMWIDAKYKLVYKVRFTNRNDKDSFYEVGQNYKGGDEITFFVHTYSAASKDNGTFTITTNLKTSVTSSTLIFIGEGSSPYNVSLSLQSKPYAGAIDVAAPSGAIKLQEVLKALGINPQSGESSLFFVASADSERQTDIRSIHSQVEAYYAYNGWYPTLANLNSPSWRKTNMPGLDDAALKDPGGSTATLATAATSTQYGYAPIGCNANSECQTYTLTAKLSTGESYTKISLN